MRRLRARRTGRAELGLNFSPPVLQITAYNRRTFETARHNLVINIMATEGEGREQKNRRRHPRAS